MYVVSGLDDVMPIVLALQPSIQEWPPSVRWLALAASCPFSPFLLVKKGGVISFLVSINLKTALSIELTLRST